MGIPQERGVDSAYVHCDEVKAAHDPETAPATIRRPAWLVVVQAGWVSSGVARQLHEFVRCDGLEPRVILPGHAEHAFEALAARPDRFALCTIEVLKSAGSVVHRN